MRARLTDAEARAAHAPALARALDAAEARLARADRDKRAVRRALRAHQRQMQQRRRGGSDGNGDDAEDDGSSSGQRDAAQRTTITRRGRGSVAGRVGGGGGGEYGARLVGPGAGGFAPSSPVLAAFAMLDSDGEDDEDEGNDDAAGSLNEVI